MPSPVINFCPGNHPQAAEGQQEHDCGSSTHSAIEELKKLSVNELMSAVLSEENKISSLLDIITQRSNNPGTYAGHNTFEVTAPVSSPTNNVELPQGHHFKKHAPSDEEENNEVNRVNNLSESASQNDQTQFLKLLIEHQMVLAAEKSLTKHIFSKNDSGEREHSITNTNDPSMVPVAQNAAREIPGPSLEQLPYPNNLSCFEDPSCGNDKISDGGKMDTQVPDSRVHQSESYVMDAERVVGSQRVAPVNHTRTQGNLQMPPSQHPKLGMVYKKHSNEALRRSRPEALLHNQHMVIDQTKNAANESRTNTSNDNSLMPSGFPPQLSNEQIQHLLMAQGQMNNNVVPPNASSPAELVQLQTIQRLHQMQQDHSTPLMMHQHARMKRTPSQDAKLKSNPPPHRAQVSNNEQHPSQKIFMQRASRSPHPNEIIIQQLTSRVVASQQMEKQQSPPRMHHVKHQSSSLPLMQVQGQNDRLISQQQLKQQQYNSQPQNDHLVPQHRHAHEELYNSPPSQQYMQQQNGRLPNLQQMQQQENNVVPVRQFVRQQQTAPPSSEQQENEGPSVQQYTQHPKGSLASQQHAYPQQSNVSQFMQQPNRTFVPHHHSQKKQKHNNALSSQQFMQQPTGPLVPHKQKQQQQQQRHNSAITSEQFMILQNSGLSSQQLAQLQNKCVAQQQPQQQLVRLRNNHLFYQQRQNSNNFSPQQNAHQQLNTDLFPPQHQLKQENNRPCSELVEHKGHNGRSSGMQCSGANFIPTSLPNSSDKVKSSAKSKKRTPDEICSGGPAFCGTKKPVAKRAKQTQQNFISPQQQTKIPVETRGTGKRPAKQSSQNCETLDKDGSADSKVPVGTLLRTLLKPVDMYLVTEFTYAVLSELETCSFSVYDGRGNRGKVSMGYPGLTCRYCKGGTPGSGMRTGRYFPTTVKTMADSKKTLIPVYDHLSMCSEVPPIVKKQLTYLHDKHSLVLSQRKLPHGGLRHFFRKLWNCIHHQQIQCKTNKRSL